MIRICFGRAGCWALKTRPESVFQSPKPLTQKPDWLGTLIFGADSMIRKYYVSLPWLSHQAGNFPAKGYGEAKLRIVRVESESCAKNQRLEGGFFK
jgi:hypothetical protein